MIRVHTAQQTRDAEAAFFAAHPGVDLMVRAADRVADQARRMVGPRARLLVVAGPGNNGGDGLFAAATLARGGARVAVWCLGERSHEAGRAAAEAAGCRFVDAATASRTLAEVDLVVDAGFGIGARPGLPPALAVFADEARDLAVAVLAVDIPSGLDADSGRLEQCLAATRTITFGSRKPCHVQQPAAEACGEVVVADIGIGAELAVQPSPLEQAERADIARLWPVPGPDSDKYSRGVVGIDTGSAQYPGAAILGTIGALHSGAGMIRFVGLGRPADLIAATLPSVTHGEGRVQARLVGSGWGSAPDNAERLHRRLHDGLPTVVDADALTVLPDQLPAGCLLTPHAGELARLLGVERQQVVDDPIEHARRAAARWGATVLLKGASQYIVEPSGRVRLAVPGPAWTAQAGSGDVLAGICATLLAADLSAADAALCGASVQAIAAASKPGPWPPEVIARELPAVIAGLAHDLNH